jgi:hypothetical protein
MTSIGHPLKGSARAAHWGPAPAFVGGLLIGALAGLVNVAMIYAAPWWAVELSGFLTSPILLLTSIVKVPTELAAAATLVAGSALLYALYAGLLWLCRGEEARVGWVLAILLLHATCLIVWLGLFLSEVVAQALAF